MGPNKHARSDLLISDDDEEQGARESQEDSGVRGVSAGTQGIDMLYELSMSQSQ